ncbi:uncharacterized protein LOC142348121 isoform X2 [Convolutriloba macropyga]|uniref:uncharacterized protein LOC142348121 isoform X2 n=1 Tax=Convolutriloba macropyga TaxID=536237 RepID=UPI003F521B89
MFINTDCSPIAHDVVRAPAIEVQQRLGHFNYPNPYHNGIECDTDYYEWAKRHNIDDSSDYRSTNDSTDSTFGSSGTSNRDTCWYTATTKTKTVDFDIGCKQPNNQCQGIHYQGGYSMPYTAFSYPWHYNVHCKVDKMNKSNKIVNKNIKGYYSHFHGNRNEQQIHEICRMKKFGDGGIRTQVVRDNSVFPGADTVDGEERKICKREPNSASEDTTINCQHHKKCAFLHKIKNLFT